MSKEDKVSAVAMWTVFGFTFAMNTIFVVTLTYVLATRLDLGVYTMPLVAANLSLCLVRAGLSYPKMRRIVEKNRS